MPINLLKKSGRTTIAKDGQYEIAESFFSKMRGLMFRRKPKTILFKFSSNENAIHSLFVFFEFDAVFLDKQKRVFQIIEKIRPFRLLIRPKAKATYLLELPPGKARELGIKEGDALEF
ncbi:putative ACR [Candidatus Gugararchaeum adminiculabundum]|nr:putative ACR [Candidatus Gugararchaeum adminiculabundum]